MDKKFSIGIIGILILAVIICGFFAFMPHYKSIEMSGYTFEVPQSNAEVKNNTINYNTYLDTENDLNIKTWSCKDLNDVNGTLNASIEMGIQLGENMGSNSTYNNFTVYNKSGTYTYYEPDANNTCMILITSKNLNTIEHILDTMNKPQLSADSSKFNMSGTGLLLTEPKNNTTENKQTTTTSSKKSSTAQKKSSSSSSNYIDDPEKHGYKSVGEAIYRKNGKVYVEEGRGNLRRAPEMDNAPYLLD